MSGCSVVLFVHDADTIHARCQCGMEEDLLVDVVTEDRQVAPVIDGDNNMSLRGRSLPGRPRHDLQTRINFIQKALRVWNASDRVANESVGFDFLCPLRTLRPLADYVVIRRDRATDTFGSGLLVRPEIAVERRPTKATVVAVGPGKLLDDGTRAPMELKVGDRVIVDAMHGQDWGPGWVNDTSKGDKALRPYHPDDLSILHESEVDCVIESGEPAFLTGFSCFDGRDHD